MNTSILESTEQSNGQLVIAIDNPGSKQGKQVEMVQKKIKRIEQLKGQIKKLNDNITLARELYDEHCQKSEKQLLKSTEELVIKLYQRYRQKGFTIWQKEIMEARLINEMDFLSASGHFPDTIADIRQELSELKMKGMDDFEKGMMEEMASEFFEDMGLDIGDIDFGEMNSPAFKKRIEDLMAEKYREEHRDSHQRSKEEGYRSQHDKVSTTNSDFQKLYKTLVKRAHPDLVVDPLEKEVREEWMKKLSEVWEKRDYYGLLLLQKEILGEDSMEVELNGSQVDSLKKELNRTISGLETEKFELKRLNPETSFYYENFNARSKKGTLKKIMEHKDYLEYKIDIVQTDITSLKTQKSTKDLLLDIREMTGNLLY